MSTRAVISALVALSACADEIDEVDLEQNSQAIIAGNPIAAEGSGFVILSNPIVSCSGTLIRNQWVLTSRHCVEEGWVNGRAVPWDPPAEVTLRMGSQTGRAAEIFLEPNNSDSALVRLQAPLSMNGSSSGYRRELANETPAQLSGSVVGCTGYGLVDPTGGFGTLRTAQLKLAVTGDPNEFYAQMNSQGHRPTNGDSGSSCILTNAQYPAGAVLGNLATTNSSGGTYRATSFYRSWALDIMEGKFSPNEEWTQVPFYGERGTLFADVTGDGKADAIVVNNSRLVVRRSTGSVLNPNEEWTQGPYFGDRGTFFADVTGDGNADAIAVNDGRIVVRRSTGSSFSANEEWTQVPYFGERGTFFADVTGDGRADAIAVNGSRVVVRRSTGSNFSANEEWTQVPYFGERGTFFVDVTGDAKADAVVVNESRVVVRRSTGSSFSANEEWTQVPYFGERGTFFADVTGDGKADAIVVNDLRVVVRRSTGSTFSPNEEWTHVPFYGDRGTFFADVSGDRKADAIAVNDSRVVVRRAR